MSRFFANDGSSSESENELAGDVGRSKFMNSDYSDSGSDSEYSSDYPSSSEGEDYMEEQAAPVRKSRFLMDSDSEEEEGSGRVLRSQKEKASDELVATISLIADSMNNDDWNGANINFDRMVKQASKSQRFGLPVEFYVFLSGLEASLTAKLNSPEAKKLEKENAKAFNAVRQKSRKIVSAHAEDIKRATSAESEQPATDDAEVPRLSRFGRVEDSGADAVKVIELTSENVIRKLQEIIASRGKKNVDRSENLTTLRKLFELATTSEQKIQILNAQVSAEFDTTSMASGHMSHALWHSALLNLTSMLQHLLAEPKFTALAVDEATVAAAADETFTGLPTVAGIRGSFSSYLYRIDDEYLRALQNIDPHSGDYVEFVKNEQSLAALLLASREFFAAVKATESESAVMLRYLEHIYYKTDAVLVKADTAVLPKEAVASLTERGNERIKQKALLCLIYHLAISDNYKVARETFVQHRFQDMALSLEIPTQIVYNRAVVQMALCAFRQGYIKDAYFSLQEICSSGRPKEFLAQGVQSQKFVEKTPEQERAERLRQLPYHMHLNVELIDCVFLTCSMILEVPQTALFSRKSHQNDRRLYQSRHLKRLIDAVERNFFNGPPENTREALVMAARKLSLADWMSASSLCLGLKVWEHIPDFDAKVRPMIVERIKESALCTYIYSFGSSFSSLSMDYLSELFELKQPAVLALVSHLIQETGLSAALDQTQSFLVWKSSIELSKVQDMTMLLADKIQLIIDRNEETADFLHRPMSHKA